MQKLWGARYSIRVIPGSSNRELSGSRLCAAVEKPSQAQRYVVQSLCSRTNGCAKIAAIDGWIRGRDIKRMRSSNETIDSSLNFALDPPHLEPLLSKMHEALRLHHHHGCARALRYPLREQQARVYTKERVQHERGRTDDSNNGDHEALVPKNEEDVSE